MTLHAQTNYKCEFCGFPFIPIEETSNCPKCGKKANKVFSTFIERTIKSALYNLAKRDSFIPGAWGFFSLGDNYYWFAFQFLEFAAHSLKVERSKLFGKVIGNEVATKLSLDFIRKIDFGKQTYRANHLQIYLARVLSSQVPVEYPESISAKTSCFLSHSSMDNEFCEKLYFDILSEGLNCWFFPENASIGKGLWDEIDKGIRQCTKVIVVCSKDSLKSPAVLREIERALQREDKEHIDILFPIMIDHYVLDEWDHNRKADVVAKVIGDFSRYQEPKEYKKQLKRLVNNMKK